MQGENSWYARIEPEVREAVRALRNKGINTTSSCGHEGTIQAETCDLSAEFHTIYTVLSELGYRAFQIRAIWDEQPAGCSSRFIAILCGNRTSCHDKPQHKG